MRSTVLSIVLRATPWAGVDPWALDRALRRSDWERPLHTATHLAPAAPSATQSANRRVMRSRPDLIPLKTQEEPGKTATKEKGNDRTTPPLT